ncbi:hypothetical protein BS17DRAFT_794587 [Gyrodon lividus]|nr:hypothetical protein BS17DRAFT_794587 [Gyrodon lividus]
MSPSKQKVHQPCTVSKPYKPSVPSKGSRSPKTLAIKKKKHSHNILTLHDWLTVVLYHDEHQPVSQATVIKHFTTKKKDKKGCNEDKNWLESTPTALSSKRLHMVTRPDVEDKGKHVTGPMLIMKREKFELALDVPEKERLTSVGWVKNFCKMM